MTFTYCGKAPEDFGCYYIPDEDQISDMMSEYEQFAEDFEARDGGYYFGDRQPPKEFDLPCYYEDIDKKTMEQIVRWLDRRTSGRLVFDERPDVYYDVVPSAKIEFEDYSYTKYGKTLHAGEFTIHFTAYDPFGKLTKKFLRTGEEMDYSTNLIPETQMPPAPSVTDTSFLVYNPGTERTGLILRIAGDAPNGQVVKNTTNGQELALLPFNQAVTTTAGKWFEIDSMKGQVYLVGAATRELAFEYHDKGYIALEANLGFEDGRIISFSQGGNTATATDDENGFSEDDIGKYIYTGDGWHKILSVSDVTIVGCGKNLYDVNDEAVFSDSVTVDADGWITVTADNSAGSNRVFRNIFTHPSSALKPDREHAIVCEIASASISSDNANLCLVNSAVSQFVTTKWLANLNVGTQVYVVKTKKDFSDCESMLRTYVQYNAGASGTIKFRLSVLEDTSITAETFEYKPYQDIPFLALDNAQGQIESVAVEAGCRARQAGTGEPSPENIRAITGRDSVEIAVCGKNLLPIRTTDDTLTGISYHSNGDGTYTVNGTSTGNAAYILLQTVIPPGNYVLSGGSNNVNVHVAEFNADGTWVSSIAMSVNGNAAAVTIQPLPAGHYHRINIGVDLGLQASSVTVYPQLEAGDTATAFEPYRSMGGGTVTPTEPLYGLPGAEDTVEVSVDGDVTVTRRTAVLELDGTENWILTENASHDVHRFDTSGITPAPNRPGSNSIVPAYLCSHYVFLSANATWSGEQGVSLADNASTLHICDMRYDTVDDFKAYLAAQKTAGTPVTIVYELATPTTETPADVDPIEPQIGEVNVFTDADSQNITLYKTENNKYASVTGSFSQTQNDFASMLTQMNEISISGEDVELTKLETDYVPQVR